MNTIKNPAKYVVEVAKARSDPLYFIKNILGDEPYPKQEEIIREFYSGDYRKLVWVSGMRSGKSRLAAWIAAYELFSLCTLSDPAKYFGLSKGSRITINIVATSTDTADDAVFGHIVHLMKYNDFINEVLNLEFRKDFIFCEDKNVKLQLLSSWTNTAVGRTSKLVVFDEISYFEENTGKRGAWEIYTRLSKSTDTLGKHGKVIAISSPKHPNDIIMTLAKNYKDDPNALVYITPTWDVNPNLSFEQLWEEHKHNPAEFWRDYGCKPTVTTMLQFPDGVKLEGENKAMIRDLVDHSYMRVLAIDPAVKKDAFGLAFGYLDEDGRVVVDGAYRFVRESDQPFISTKEIRAYIEDIVYRYNIFAVVFDVWMYPGLIEWMSDDLGLIVVQHVVQKKDYDRWKEMQDEGTVKVCEYDVLREEAESLLVINDRRVDHAYNKSKDVADCVANVIWMLTENDDIASATKIKFSPSQVKVF